MNIHFLFQLLLHVVTFLGRNFDMGPQERLTDSHLSLLTLRYCHIKDVFRE